MKIGILGTAHTFHQAPFADLSWELWACNLGLPPRWDRWFQLHNDAVIDGNAGHRDWLAAQTKPVYLQKADPSIPKGVAYPLEAMKAKYGTWFLTSSIAFMLALALEEPGLKELGLWGVEMSDATEYGAQKNGVRFFLQLARMQGVTITVPPECELLVPGRTYGYDAPSWLEMKARARHAELVSRDQENNARLQGLMLQKASLMGKRDITLSPEDMEKQLAQTTLELGQAQENALVLSGAIQDVTYVLANWTGVQHEG